MSNLRNRLASMNKESIGRLKLLLCEDWFIYAYDPNGKVYMINTELWPEWLDISQEEQNKSNSVEKFMLPIAKKKWNLLSWQDTGETVNTFFGNINEEELKQKFEKYQISISEDE